MSADLNELTAISVSGSLPALCFVPVQHRHDEKEPEAKESATATARVLPVAAV